MSLPDLRLYFSPTISLCPAAGGGRQPVLIASLLVPCGNGGDDFSRLAKVVYAAALRSDYVDGAGPWNADKPADTPVTLADVERIRTRLSLPKTLARTLIGDTTKGLDYAKLQSLLQANFTITLRGVDETSPSSMAHFPMVPDLQLTTPDSGGTIRFSIPTPPESPPVSSDFEEALDVLMNQQVWQVSPAPPPVKSAMRSELAFSVLMFEQYFDHLISVMNDRLWNLLRVQPNARPTLGDLLNKLTDDYSDIAGHAGIMLCSGLRLPAGLDPAGKLLTTRHALAVLTRQQVAIRSAPAAGVGAYPIVLDVAAANTWIAAAAPAAGYDKIDGDGIRAFLSAGLNLQPTLAEALSPLAAGDARFPFSVSRRWVRPGEATAIWFLPGAAAAHCANGATTVRRESLLNVRSPSRSMVSRIG